MEMYTIGIWGYSLASVAYILFSLLVIAAHNESSTAKLVLFSALMAAVANVFAALQISLTFSLQWAMLADAVKLAAFSVLTLSFNVEKNTIKDIVKNKTVGKYLIFWLAAATICWVATSSLGFSYEYLFLLFVYFNPVYLHTSLVYKCTFISVRKKDTTNS